MSPPAHPGVRSIPTCVGTTLSNGHHRKRLTVHPHVRGDYNGVGFSKFDGERSIPTCVGTTVSGPRMSWASTVHPHVRGDYGAHRPRGEPHPGPSPRAWGLPRPGGPPRRPGRSIPTCVGTTNEATARTWGTSVHPHVRGDYPVGRLDFNLYVGPSPRAWGLRRRGRTRIAERRSIPTCVGTTAIAQGIQFLRGGPSPRAWGLRSAPTTPAPTPVHPHVRGDYPSPSFSRTGPPGPSPRAWGLRPSPPGEGKGERSIPTCVGTTAWSTCARPPGGVHPHVRGDYT